MLGIGLFERVVLCCVKSLLVKRGVARVVNRVRLEGLFS